MLLNLIILPDTWLVNYINISYWHLISQSWKIPKLNISLYVSLFSTLNVSLPWVDTIVVFVCSIHVSFVHFMLTLHFMYCKSYEYSWKPTTQFKYPNIHPHFTLNSPWCLQHGNSQNQIKDVNLFGWLIDRCWAPGGNMANRSVSWKTRVPFKESGYYKLLNK